MDTIDNLLKVFGRAWHVNATECLKRLAHIENAGSPLSSVTPDFPGQECLDTTNNQWWKAHGTTSADWKPLSNQGVIVSSTNAGTLALTAATHGGKTVYFNDADGTITLPNATGSGVKFKVVIGTAATAMSITVKPATDEEFMGGVNGVDDDADAPYAWKAEDNDDKLALNGTATGGKVGDWFEFEDVAVGLWLVNGFITQSGGSEATPFTAAISS